MNKIKVLVQGYAKSSKEGELASSSCVLIKDGKLNIIIDPGMNKQLLINSLKKEKLKPEKVNYVVLTHYHLDHSLLTGFFNNAQVLDDSSIYSFLGKISDHDGKIPGTNIEIIKTPGHDPFHCSVLIKTQKSGNIIIAGDIFWWPDSKENNIKKDIKSLINMKDPYMKDKKQLTDSRKKILKIADYIIPGHGRMFKVEK
jgi:glyoxylase-like metal-dependent hydrolase (beta-lactamase superfamily II)